MLTSGFYVNIIERIFFGNHEKCSVEKICISHSLLAQMLQVFSEKYESL